jgi:hypothetical protein
MFARKKTGNEPLLKEILMVKRRRVLGATPPLEKRPG